MLNLSRRKGEIIVIRLEDRREIEVIVTKVSGKKIQLGFVAPRSIEILREEIKDVPR